MFRPSCQVLGKLLYCLSSSRPLQIQTYPISLIYRLSRRSPAVSTSRFFSSRQDKSTEKPFRDICKVHSFYIGSKQYLFHIKEAFNTKEIILVITKINEYKRHLCHIWISIPAANILLYQLNTYEDKIMKEQAARRYTYISHFIDTERNSSIILSRVEDYVGNKFLKIQLSSLVQDKRQTIFISLEGISRFKGTLSTTLRNYEILKDASSGILNEPNRPSAFSDLCKPATFAFSLTRYFVKLVKGNVDGKIKVLLSERFKDSGKYRHIFVPLEAAHSLFSLLKDGCDVIRSHEGRIPRWKEPLDSLFEKSFTDHDEKYTIVVQVSQQNMRHIGDMILKIKTQNTIKNLESCISIQSHGAPFLLRNFEKVLQEYKLLESLIEADKPTVKNPEYAYIPENQHFQEVVMFQAEDKDTRPDFNDPHSRLELVIPKFPNIHEERQSQEGAILKSVTNPDLADMKLDSGRDQKKEVFESIEVVKIQENRGFLWELTYGLLLIVAAIVHQIVYVVI